MPKSSERAVLLAPILALTASTESIVRLPTNVEVAPLEVPKPIIHTSTELPIVTALVTSARTITDTIILTIGGGIRVTAF